MNRIESQERTRFWRIPQLGNLELLHAFYRRQTFGPHFHEGFVVGVIEAGALGYRYLGQDNVASAGEINLALPGEVHNGFAAGDTGWRYRMFYFSPDYLERIVSPTLDQAPDRIRITQGKIIDRALARKLLLLHCSLEDPDTPLLQKESGLVAVMTDLVKRHAESSPKTDRDGNEPRAVRRAKDYIQSRYEENISLTDLSLMTGLSRFHLLRVFKKATGLTPHSYLLQVRVVRAKRLLARGRSIAEAALNTGFFDQSHLNRVFKKIHGVTPGSYRNNIQDPAPLS